MIFLYSRNRTLGIVLQTPIRWHMHPSTTFIGGLVKHFQKTAALLPALAVLLCGGSSFAAAPKFHIGVCTGDRHPGRGRSARRRAADQGIRLGVRRRHDPAHHLPGRLHVPAGDRHLQPGVPGRRPPDEGDRHLPGHARAWPRPSSAIRAKRPDILLPRRRCPPRIPW